jgi:hypothetical protein
MESFSDNRREFRSIVPDESHIIVAGLVVIIAAQLLIRLVPVADASACCAGNSSLTSGLSAPTVDGTIRRYSEKALAPQVYRFWCSPNSITYSQI